MKLIAFPSLFFFLFHLAFPAYSQDMKKLDELYHSVDSAQRMIGSVTITKDDATISEYIFGRSILSDEGKPVVNGEGLPQMRLGDGSKLFTAVLIMQLIEEGQLTLDTKLEKFYPQIKNASLITIKNLLEGTSGIPDFDVDYQTNGGDSWLNSTQSRDEIIASIAAQASLYEPGTKKLNSDTDYVLLGIILEDITSSPYYELVNRRIAQSLELLHTYADAYSDGSHGGIYSYYKENSWIQYPPADIASIFGCAAIVTTSNDLSTFYSAIIEGKVVNESSLQTLMKVGFCFDSILTGETLHHSQVSSIDSFSTIQLYIEGEKLCITVMAAGLNYPIGELFWKIYDIYYGNEPGLPTFTPIAISSKSLTKYTGEFATASGLSIEIEQKDEELYFVLKEKGYGKLKLDALDESWFQYEPKGIMLRFGRNEKGRINQVLFYQGKEVVRFDKKSKKD